METRARINVCLYVLHRGAVRRVEKKNQTPLWTAARIAQLHFFLSVDSGPAQEGGTIIDIGLILAVQYETRIHRIRPL